MNSLLGLNIAFLLAACSNTSEKPLPLMGEYLEDIDIAYQPEMEKPKLALVLGGGGIRGFAHIGVLKALEEAHIKPDIIVGTSVGAVVGAAFASGLNAREIELIAQKLVLKELIDFTLSSNGIMRGNRIVEWIGQITLNNPVETFPIQYAAVATDLKSMKGVLLRKGAPGRIVQASTAVPGLTVPVPYGGGYLIDGGVANLVPVRFARAMGADFTIAVDIFCQENITQVSLGILPVLSRVLHAQSCMIASEEMSEADVLISPEISVSGISDEQSHLQAIVSGYNATKEAIESIRSKIQILE